MTDPQPPGHTKVRQELQRLAGELEQATTPGHRAEIHRLVDKWLDARLEQNGAHPQRCGCHKCDAQVQQALAHRHRDDTASVHEWGPLG